jgi:hypothetical protein
MDLENETQGNDSQRLMEKAQTGRPLMFLRGAAYVIIGGASLVGLSTLSGGCPGAGPIEGDVVATTVDGAQDYSLFVGDILAGNDRSTIGIVLPEIPSDSGTVKYTLEPAGGLELKETSTISPDSIEAEIQFVCQPGYGAANRPLIGHRKLTATRVGVFGTRSIQYDVEVLPDPRQLEGGAAPATQPATPTTPTTPATSTVPDFIVYGPSGMVTPTVEDGVQTNRIAVRQSAQGAYVAVTPDNMPRPEDWTWDVIWMNATANNGGIDFIPMDVDPSTGTQRAAVYGKVVGSEMGLRVTTNKGKGENSRYEDIYFTVVPQ